jgi:hypothetical protein
VIGENLQRKIETYLVLDQGSYSRDNIWGFKIGEDGLSGHGPHEEIFLL